MHYSLAREIKRCIQKSRDGSVFGKQVLIWMIRQSLDFERAVAVSFPAELLKEGMDVVDSLQRMNSLERRTQLQKRIHLSGSKMKFSIAKGIYEPGGRYLWACKGYTIWLHENDAIPDPAAIVVPLDIRAIAEIKI